MNIYQQIFGDCACRCKSVNSKRQYGLQVKIRSLKKHCITMATSDIKPAVLQVATTSKLSQLIQIAGETVNSLLIFVHDPNELRISSSISIVHLIRQIVCKTECYIIQIFLHLPITTHDYHINCPPCSLPLQGLLRVSSPSLQIARLSQPSTLFSGPP